MKEQYVFEVLVNIERNMAKFSEFQMSERSIPKYFQELSSPTVKKIFGRFKDIGFLEERGKSEHKGNLVDTYFLSFSKLEKDSVLCQIYEKDSELYKHNKKAFSELSRQQKKEMKSSKKDPESRVHIDYRVSCIIQAFNKGCILGTDYSNKQTKDKKKYPPKLVCKTRRLVKTLNEIADLYEETDIEKSAFVFAVKIAKDELSVKKPVEYFFHREEGGFPVVQKCYDEYVVDWYEKIYNA